MRFLLPALAAVLIAAPVAANEVFRTIDERGVVIYSDRPLSAASQRVKVETQPTDPERVAAESDALRQAGADRRQRAADDQTLAAGMAEQARLREEACRQARSAAEAYETSPRLYETLPDGGRRYLSDEEIVRARQQARQAVSDFCDE